MRIVAGQWRGRPLVAPEGIATRPTADRVRETLFSMLSSRIGSFEDLRVADLFAGSGALGLEALSRGAGFACFVEQDRKAIAALRSNVEALGASERVRILAGTALNLPKERPFDLILADPPYAPGSGTEALRHLRESGWAAPGTWISIETERKDKVDASGWTMDCEREIGRARISLIRA